MKYKLNLSQKLSIEELKSKVDSGYRFFVFQYCFSPIFATYFPFSPAVFIKNPDEAKPLIKKYNRISAFFGWWGIPYGPGKTIECIRLNNKGGLDITDDVMLNITEEDLQNNMVELAETTLLYNKPEKGDIKTLKKICRDYEFDYNFKECVAAWSIYSEYSHCFCVGINTDKNFQKYADVFEQILRKKFFKHVQIEIIDLKLEHENNPWLRKQGEVIISR